MLPPLPPSRLPERLVGTRVVLDRHRVEMAEELFALVEKDRAHLAENLHWPDHMLSVDDERDYLRRSVMDWDACQQHNYVMRAPDGEIAGIVGTHNLSWSDACGEIGYWIASWFQGRGMVTEAVRLIEAEMFAIGFHRIEIRCDPDNVKSAAIPQRLGYRLEGHLREDDWRPPKWRDTLIYAKIAPT